MMAYVGDTRSRKLIAKLRDYDVGQVVQRGRLHYEIHLRPWFYDNGAFEDWKAERPFDSGQVLADIATIDEMDDKPNFMVLPDEVAGGKRSLHMSMSWLERVPRDNWYLAVQDGIEPADVPWGEGFRGIFIGGTLPWKRATAREWVLASQENEVACHYARCGTGKRIAHAKHIGADSLDSSLPLWSTANCRYFLAALLQEPLFPEGTV